MSDIPIGNMDENGKVDGQSFLDWMSRAQDDIAGASAYRWDRERPYNGQAHTDFGNRGQTLVAGLTFRDVMDCFISGLLDCCDQPELHAIADRAVWENLYDVDLSKVDPGAWWQNTAIRMEKMMGIYPNVEGLNLIPLHNDGWVQIDNGFKRQIG